MEYVGLIYDINDGYTERPASYKAYFRYALVNGEIPNYITPDVCVYSDTYGGELCLKFDDYENNIEKIKNYFSVVEDEEYADNWNSSYAGVTCDVNDSTIKCYDNNIEIEIHSNGYMHAANKLEKFKCSDIGLQHFYCSYYN